jgi:hypothetical protein
MRWDIIIPLVLLVLLSAYEVGWWNRIIENDIR